MFLILLELPERNPGHCLIGSDNISSLFHEIYSSGYGFDCDRLNPQVVAVIRDLHSIPAPWQVDGAQPVAGILNDLSSKVSFKGV
jgi:hypothetical protein